MTPQERAAIQSFYYRLHAGVEGGEFQERYEQEDIGRIIELLDETRRAALLEVSRRLLPNAQSAMLDAPCLWCGYNGEGYWQPTTHELTCPWHNVGGRFDRVVALDRLAQEG